MTNDGSVPFKIEMNEPLRYSGYTFFQSSFTDDEMTSVFQVVKNPSWLMPYLSSFIIVLGLFVQMIFLNEEALIMIKRLFYYVFLAYIIVGVIDTPSLIDRSLGRLPVLHDGRIKIIITGSIARPGITNTMVIFNDDCSRCLP